jgi:hypothetical protein
MCLHLGHDVLRVQREIFVLSELHVIVYGADEELLQQVLVFSLSYMEVC